MQCVTVMILVVLVMQANAKETGRRGKEVRRDSIFEEAPDLLLDKLVDKAPDLLLDKLVDKFLDNLGDRSADRLVDKLVDRQSALKAMEQGHLNLIQTSPASAVVLKLTVATTILHFFKKVSNLWRSTFAPKQELQRANSFLTFRAEKESQGSVPSPLAPPPSALAITKAVFNLVKNIVGCGVLSLPAGVAAVGGQPALLAPAISLVIILGAISAYTFFSVGRQCGLHDVSTYDTAWAKAVGARSAPAVTSIAILFPLLACTIYTIIIGDSFSELARGGVLGPFMENNAVATDRRTWIAAFSIGILYPLCALRSIGALASTSLLGVLAQAYTGVFMTIRAADGTYSKGGKFSDSVLMQPSFDIGGMGTALKEFFSRPGTFVLMALCGTTFNAHTNAPIFFNEAARRDYKAFALITILGFGFAVLLNLVFLVSGFLTFGGSSAGLILNNYSPTDPLACVARALYGFAVVFTYPVILAGFKSIATDLLIRSTKNKLKDGFLLNQLVTVVPVVGITITALLVANAGVVNAMFGSICGSCLIYIYPGLMYVIGSRWIKAKRNIKVPVLSLTKEGRGVKNLEYVGNIAVIATGAIMGVLGVFTSAKPPPPPPLPAAPKR